MKATLLDYGAGNLPSLERALRRLGVESCRATAPKCIAGAEVLLLPGVGHYATLIRALDHRNLRQALLDALAHGVPFLGICLGLQALYDGSDEAPGLAGLRLLAGRVSSLPSNVKLPHMGWNQIRAARDSRLLEGIGTGAYFYFAHSYAATHDGAGMHAETVATCEHGAEFSAVIEKQNVFGVQFHPEKSGEAGSRLLANFLMLVAA